MPLCRALNIPLAVLSSWNKWFTYSLWNIWARGLPLFGRGPTRGRKKKKGQQTFAPFAGLICGRAFLTRELSDLNYKSWMLAFSSQTHKSGLYTPLLCLSFVRKGLCKSRRVSCFNKPPRVPLFQSRSVFYQRYFSGLLCRLVPALTSLARRITTWAWR